MKSHIIFFTVSGSIRGSHISKIYETEKINIGIDLENLVIDCSVYLLTQNTHFNIEGLAKVCLQLFI